MAWLTGVIWTTTVVAAAMTGGNGRCVATLTEDAALHELYPDVKVAFFKVSDGASSEEGLYEFRVPLDDLSQPFAFVVGKRIVIPQQVTANDDDAMTFHSGEFHGRLERVPPGSGTGFDVRLTVLPKHPVNDSLSLFLVRGASDFLVARVAAAGLPGREEIGSLPPPFINVRGIVVVSPDGYERYFAIMMPAHLTDVGSPSDDLGDLQGTGVIGSESTHYRLRSGFSARYSFGRDAARGSRYLVYDEAHLK